MNKLNGVLYIILSAISFGIMPILAKFAYKGGASTYTVLFLRFFIAVIIILYYLLSKRISFKINKKDIILLMILGAGGYGITEICIFSSYKYISVGLAANILYTYPAIVTILSLFVYKEKLYTRKILSLIFSLVGIYMLVGVKNSSFNFIGIILAFSAAVFNSLYVLGISNKRIRNINNYVITFYVSLSSSIIMFILGVTTKTLNFDFTFYSLVCMIMLAFISTVIALVMFVKGAKIIGPSKASILSTLEPIVSLILGWIVLKEKFFIQVFIGSILVIISVLILAKENL